MKKIFSIFLIVLLTTFYYVQTSNEACYAHSCACDQNIIDTCISIEDSCQEDNLVFTNISLLIIPFKPLMTGTLIPITITGERPYIWQPPEA
jgi:hypothetical protein